ncbi:ABC-three component system protein [Rouxiella badensis]|uniref:ABC-three component system protein n=1 Tax=Rouxiella badensis TaxID=1646377 RepID=UPI0028D7A7F1|nr:ABC-three component system protein [Rouxiella badensis]
MADIPTDKFAAGKQGLGYIYQPRLALLKLLQLPEHTAVLLEKDDDLDLVSSDGSKILASLKHKARDDLLTDLSTDFWKSVNIWLVRYKRDGRAVSNLRFFMLTTSVVSSSSFLTRFLPDPQPISADAAPLVELANVTLSKTNSQTIIPVAEAFNELSDSEKQDFLERIMIFDGSPRIEDIPTLVMNDHMRSVRREYRSSVFQRLEGWWIDTIIKQLTGAYHDGVYGYEISDKLSSFAEEYKSDNLPITFRGKEPDHDIDTEFDTRLFVKQLRHIGLSSNRIRSAIIDYYRAFEQRSVWARESLLVSGEVEDYEYRLTEEWERYKNVVFEKLSVDSADEALIDAGNALYNWAEFEAGKTGSLRIRALVSEPYVLRGSYHILANKAPKPSVYWHPHFLEHLHTALGGSI